MFYSLKKAIFFFCFIYAQKTTCQSIKVAIASSLISPLSEISSEFENSKNIKIELIPGASGTLTHQIINGAPFDLFISANPQYCELLEQKGLSRFTKHNLFNGPIVLWSKTPLDTINKSVPKAFFDAVIQDHKQSIAIANPSIAPYGKIAMEWITSTGLNGNNLQIIEGNNISLTNQYISTVSVDFAITSLSSRKNLAKEGQGFWYDRLQLEFSAAHCLSTTSSNLKAQEFMEFLSSELAIKHLTNYGYISP
ncbi:MAG: molybdate ABC transporter substrate-binding protein [Reichenbachiella sp.]